MWERSVPRVGVVATMAAVSALGVFLICSGARVYQSGRKP